MKKIIFLLSALFAQTCTSDPLDICVGCHGVNGISPTPTIPTIAGMDWTYFVEAMNRFKNADLTSTMHYVAIVYTNEEIKQLADIYSKRKFLPAKQAFDKALVGQGKSLHDTYCETCHSEGGKTKEEGSVLLAGQWTSYLKARITDIASGFIPVEKKMAKEVKVFLKKEGEEGLTALLAYYASQQ